MKKVSKKTKKNNILDKMILAGISLEKIGVGSLVRIEIDYKEKTTTVELMKSPIDFLNLNSKDIKK